MIRAKGVVIDKAAATRIATSLGWEPKREWVGLTDEEIKDAFCANGKNAQFWWEYTNPDCVAIGRAIEAKLKEKNT